jgi:hypothetical protein
MLFETEMRLESHHYYFSFNCALTYGHLDIIEFVISLAVANGVNETASDNIPSRKNLRDRLWDDVLLQSARYGHEDAVLLALEKGANRKVGPRFAGHGWNNALEAAVIGGHVSIVRLLLRKGAKQTPYDLRIPLAWAIRRGWHQLAELFLQPPYNAEIICLIKDPHCHLTRAVKCGEVEILELLLKARGTELKANTEVCKAAYDLAIASEYWSMVQCFKDYGVIVDYGLMIC